MFCGEEQTSGQGVWARSLTAFAGSGKEGIVPARRPDPFAREVLQTRRAQFSRDRISAIAGPHILKHLYEG